MAALFAKRLSCFYCGRRSAQSGPVRRWHCDHCEAINYLDEKGEITDPPAAETNPTVYGSGASDTPFESTDFTASGLFCAQCIRNQHLFMSALGNYFPSTDDPSYIAYEREYPKFRKNLEERYPQVCARCEPRVRDRIRQTGYEAKSDHLRRMMDRSKAGRTARQARDRNWRSLLVFAGAIGYWGSVAGQLAWDIMGAVTGNGGVVEDRTPLSLESCIERTLLERQLPSACSIDLAPYAGISLIVGILSLWWNPRLRLKIEGRGGRFVGLGEYYKVQLIVIVVRCAFWAVLKDPSSSGLQPNLPPALHLFMIFFTILSVAISRRVVQYDTRPLVTWNDITPAATPNRKIEASQIQSTGSKSPFKPSNERLGQTPQRFPLEKLAIPRASPAQAQETAIPTPPPEVDDMDWTPSAQHDIRPMHSVYERDQKSVLDGPMPFYGSLPAAPKPPAWKLRSQPATPKPIEQVVEPNPFHRTPVQPPGSWKRDTGRVDPVFAPPKFFPISDYEASTGLENLFDQAFTIKTPEDDGKEERKQQAPRQNSRQPFDSRNVLVFQYLRLGLLVASLLAWTLSQNDLTSVPGNYIEIASLGSASLIAGFALLEALKQPIVYWNGMEILVYFAELAAAVHLGGNLPRVSFAREYFDRYGKLLLVFMAAQEALALLSLHRFIAADTARTQEQPANHALGSSSNLGAFDKSPAPTEKAPISPPAFQLQPQNPLSSVPPLSFSSTAPSSSFSPQPSEPYCQLPYSSFNQGFNNSSNRNTNNLDHSFTLDDLKENEADASDNDSDTETTMTSATTATNATNATIRNIRYGGASNDNFYSPRKSDIGPGIDGLSLEDKPMRRVTRSQTKQNLGGDPFSRRYAGRLR